MPVPETLFWQRGKRLFIAKPELSAASIIFGGTVSSPSNMTSFLIQVWWKTLDLSCFCQPQRQTCQRNDMCDLRKRLSPFPSRLCSIFHESLFLCCITGEMSHSSLSPLPSRLLQSHSPAGPRRMLGQAALGHLSELDLQWFISHFPLEINAHM